MVLEGDCSEEVPVTSGVPQGSVFGPILFLTYINDLPDKVKSQVRLFADDTAAYLAITKLSDSGQLQADLDILQEWETRWDMQFKSNRKAMNRNWSNQKANPLLKPKRLNPINAR